MVRHESSHPEGSEGHPIYFLTITGCTRGTWATQKLSSLARSLSVLSAPNNMQLFSNPQLFVMTYPFCDYLDSSASLLLDSKLHGDEALCLFALYSTEPR